jgi:hypothetical protein
MTRYREWLCCPWWQVQNQKRFKEEMIMKIPKSELTVCSKLK